MSKSVILGASVYEPPQQNRKDKAELRVLRCSLDGDCPFLAKGQCIEMSASFLSHGCLYGRITRTDGYTRRAAGFRKKVKEFRAKRDEYGPMPGRAPQRVTRIGEFVWLPYLFMTMCKSVPFVAHSGAFAVGRPFVPIRDFTPETIVTLTKFQPRALMGGIIRGYQKESLPIFLFHLKHEMPDLYARAAAIDESVLSRTFTLDSLGGKATVSVDDVRPGIEVALRDWKGIWNGNEIVFTQTDSSHIIGMYDSQITTLTIHLQPANSVKVTIEDESEIARLWNEGKVTV